MLSAFPLQSLEVSRKKEREVGVLIPFLLVGISSGCNLLKATVPDEWPAPVATLAAGVDWHFAVTDAGVTPFFADFLKLYYNFLNSPFIQL